MTRRQASGVVVATWLIGLGAVFLVREAAGWSWSEAWPLFVIVVGVASAVGVTVHEERRGRGILALWSYTWAVIWIGAGALLLASTTGATSGDPYGVIDQWWPWVAIGLGAWFLLGAVIPSGVPAVQAFGLPVGDLHEAAIVVRFGAGELRVRAAAPGRLVDGTFPGGLIARNPAPGRFELEQDTRDGWPWLDHEADWDLGLARDLPLDLGFETGACRAQLDLSELRVRTLRLQTGASHTTVRLPRAAGATSVIAHAGAAELVLEVPTGVAARIRGRMVLGATRVDETRFPRALDGSYRSPDFDTAPNRVDVEVDGGIGAIRVIGESQALAA